MQKLRLCAYVCGQDRIPGVAGMLLLLMSTVVVVDVRGQEVDPVLPLEVRNPAPVSFLSLTDVAHGSVESLNIEQWEYDYSGRERQRYTSFGVREVRFDRQGRLVYRRSLSDPGYTTRRYGYKEGRLSRIETSFSWSDAQNVLRFEYERISEGWRVNVLNGTEVVGTEVQQFDDRGRLVRNEYRSSDGRGESWEFRFDQPQSRGPVGIVEYRIRRGQEKVRRMFDVHYDEDERLDQVAYLNPGGEVELTNAVLDRDDGGRVSSYAWELADTTATVHIEYSLDERSNWVRYIRRTENHNRERTFLNEEVSRQITYYE